MVSRTDDETMRIPERRDHPVRARQSGRQRSGGGLVHARSRIPQQRTLGEPAAAVPEATSATTTTATSSRRRSPRPRTSTACCIASGSRRFSTTTIRAARRARCCGRRRCAIRSTTTRIRCSCSASRRSASRCTRGWRPKASRARRRDRAGRHDGWWNGGIRNTAAFHNTIAILTEMIGSPTPMRVPLVMDRQLPQQRSDRIPVPPQEWHFRTVDRVFGGLQSRASSIIASRMRENFLFNRYVMGKNSIERGSRDTLDAGRRGATAARSPPNDWQRRRGHVAGATMRALGRAARARRTARSARLSSSRRISRDFPTATKFINALLETGIAVPPRDARLRRGGQDVSGRLVRCAQPRRRFVRTSSTCSSRRIIPTTSRIPARRRRAPATTTPAGRWRSRWACSSIASWSRLHRAVRGDHRLERHGAGWQGDDDDWRRGLSDQPSGARLVCSAQPAARRARRRRVAAGPLAAAGRTYPAGTFYVPARPSTLALIQHIAPDRGVSFDATSERAPATAWTLKRPRIGLWDQYGGSIDAGWARWILEQFEFTFDRVFAPTLDGGNLNAKSDALVFVEGAIPAAAPARGGRGRGAEPPPNIPGIPGTAWPRHARQDAAEIKRFLENGGTVVALGDSATDLASFLRAANRKPSGRGRRAVAANEVLHAGVGAPGARRHVTRSRTGWPSGPTCFSRTALCSSWGRPRRLGA